MSFLMNNFQKRWQEWKTQMKVEMEDFLHHLKDEFRRNFHPVKTTLVLAVCGFGILLALWNWVSGEPPEEKKDPGQNQEVPSAQEKGASEPSEEESDTQDYGNEKEARKTVESFLEAYFNFDTESISERPEKAREWITGRLYANLRDMSGARPTYDMQSARLMDIKEIQMDAASNTWHWMGDVKLEIEDGAKKKRQERYRLNLTLEMLNGEWRVSEVVQSSGTEDGNSAE